MTSKLPVLEQAKHGDAKAIAALLNRHLQAKGIAAKAKLKGSCLLLMLESNRVPNREAMVQFVRQGMQKLGVKSIHSVKIYGKQTEINSPAWSQNIDLSDQSQSLPKHSRRDESTQNLKTSRPNLSDSMLVTAPTSRNITQESSQRSTATRQKIPTPKRLGQLLIGSLWFRIGFDSLFVLYALFWATSYYIYDLLDVADTTGFLAYLLGRLVVAIDSLWTPLENISVLIYLFSLVILLVWLHRVHAYLRSIDRNYPITPWGAITRFVIPIYSLWGMWNTLNTLATRLKSQGGQLTRQGKSLKRCIPWLYVALISSNLLDRIYGLGIGITGEENGSPWFYLVNSSTYLFLSLVWLQIARIISQAIAEKAKLNSIQPLTERRDRDEGSVKPPKDTGINRVSPPKRFSLTAIIFGVAFALIGTSVVGVFMGIIASVVLISRGVRFAEFTTVLYSSMPFLVSSLGFGLLLTIPAAVLGGYLRRIFRKHRSLLI